MTQSPKSQVPYVVLPPCGTKSQFHQDRDLMLNLTFSCIQQVTPAGHTCWEYHQQDNSYRVENELQRRWLVDNDEQKLVQPSSQSTGWAGGQKIITIQLER